MIARKPQATAATEAAPAVARSAKGARYVTVASKLPMSLELQLCAPKTARVTGQFGSVEETVHVKSGPVWVIRGNGYPNGQPPKGYPKRPEEVEETGYALTRKVDADFFEEWQRQNADTDIVRNGLIFAHADDDYIEGIAREYAGIDCGLGPINTDGDRRSPKPLNSSLQEVKKAQAAA